MRVVEVYTDGSFNSSKKMYGSGVIYDVKGDKREFKFGSSDPVVCQYWSAAGEIMAVMFAVKRAIHDKFEKIIIHHDLENLSKWTTGKSEAKSPIAKQYLNF